MIVCYVIWEIKHHCAFSYNSLKLIPSPWNAYGTIHLAGSKCVRLTNEEPFQTHGIMMTTSFWNDIARHGSLPHVRYGARLKALNNKIAEDWVMRSRTATHCLGKIFKPAYRMGAPLFHFLLNRPYADKSPQKKGGAYICAISCFIVENIRLPAILSQRY